MASAAGHTLFPQMLHESLKSNDAARTTWHYALVLSLKAAGSDQGAVAKAAVQRILIKQHDMPAHSCHPHLICVDMQ